MFWFTSTTLNFYYYGTTNSDQYNFDIRVYAWANVQAFNDRNWLLFSSQTNSQWSYQYIYYASDPSYSVLNAAERSFGGVMDLPTSDSTVGRTHILTSSNHVQTSGSANVFYVSSTQIKVRLSSTASKSFYKVYRMGFRFYTPRLKTTTCSSVSVWTSRWGWNNFNGYANSPSSFVVSCGNAGANTRRFYAIFDMYYTPSSTTYPYQWPDFGGSDTYEFTFTFSSVSGDVGTYPNYLWVSASMVFEESYYYYQSSTCGCGCSSYCCQTCCCSYCCQSCCHYYCNCRKMLGWDYYTFTGTQSVGYTQPSNALADGISIDLVSNQYNVETEFSFYIQNIKKTITSTMTSSTVGSHAELVVVFDSNGNNHFSNSNPFPYTDYTESAASIECMCINSGSSLTITSTLSYQNANCTRYIISGMDPFLAVRHDVSAGQYLRCYFPGFNTPTSSSYGTSLSVSFYWNPMHFFNKHSIPYAHHSSYETRYVTKSLTTTGTSNSFYDLNEGSKFWVLGGEVNEVK